VSSYCSKIFSELFFSERIVRSTGCYSENYYLQVDSRMSNKANKGSNPGAKSEEENDKPWHDQFEKKQTQTQNEPE
jgi:hypothetical protein